MAGFLDLEPAPNRVHHVMRGGADRFVDEQRAVERTEFVHARFFFTDGLSRKYAVERAPHLDPLPALSGERKTRTDLS